MVFYFKHSCILHRPGTGRFAESFCVISKRFRCNEHYLIFFFLKNYILYKSRLYLKTKEKKSYGYIVNLEKIRFQEENRRKRNNITRVYIFSGNFTVIKIVLRDT